MSTGTVELPNGNIDLGPEDLFVVHLDGALWVHPGALGDDPGTPWRLADLEDPRLVDNTSPSPATLQGVAGDVNGVVYFRLSAADPLAWNLFAGTGENADRVPLEVGVSQTLALSPDGTRLATTNSDGLVIIDLTTGSYEARPVPCGEPQPMMPCANGDVIWTPDGTSLVFLYFEAGLDQFGLMSIDPRAPFPPGPLTLLGEYASPVYFDDHYAGHFAGLGPGGEIGVSFGDAAGTVIRYFDASTLTEVPDMQQTLPPGVASVRLAADGVGLMWVDNATLWYLPADGAVRNLGSGYTAAWFAV